VTPKLFYPHKLHMDPTVSQLDADASGDARNNLTDIKPVPCEMGKIHQ
jgi:hypothetical protein